MRPLIEFWQIQQMEPLLHTLYSWGHWRWIGFHNFPGCPITSLSTDAGRAQTHCPYLHPKHLCCWNLGRRKCINGVYWIEANDYNNNQMTCQTKHWGSSKGGSKRTAKRSNFRIISKWAQTLIWYHQGKPHQRISREQLKHILLDLTKIN